MTEFENKNDENLNNNPFEFYELDENTIIANAKAGDSDSFGALADRYRSLIGYALGNYCIPESERDDLLQECYIGLLKAIRTYDGESASFGTYAFACVRNSLITALKKYRKETRKIILLDKIPNSTPVSPETLFVDEESTLNLYYRILVKLSCYEKIVFELYLGEKSVGEIAKLTKRDKKSVSNAIARIKQKINRTLSND